MTTWSMLIFPVEAKCETQLISVQHLKAKNIWSRKANAHKCAIESQQPKEAAIDNMSKLRSLIFIISFIAFNWCLPPACPSDGRNIYMQSASHKFLSHIDTHSVWHDSKVLSFDLMIASNGFTLLLLRLLFTLRFDFKLNGSAWRQQRTKKIALSLTLNCYSIAFHISFRSIAEIHCMWRSLSRLSTTINMFQSNFNRISLEFISV